MQSGLLRDTPTVVSNPTGRGKTGSEPAAVAAAPTVVLPTRGARAGQIQVGTVLNNTHRIEALVARGGMGEIYRATNLTNGESVAVKTLRPELADDPKLVELFHREGAALRKLRDPAIVYYEGTFFGDGGLLYLVMEFIDGPSLAQVARGKPLSVADVRRLRDRLAAGLAAAHAEGVIHRDLSPENVILPGGRLEDAKIIDFGIAKLQTSARTTVIGRDFAGKLDYAAPEQFGLFGGTVDGRSDIYSLGLVLLFAATGTPTEASDSLVGAIEARKRLPDLSQVPPELREELAWMLQPDPAERPPSMAAIIASPVPSPAPAPAAQAAPAASVAPSAAAAPAARRLRLHPRAVGPLLALAITLVGFGSLYLSHAPGPAAPADGTEGEEIAVIPPLPPPSLPSGVTTAEPAAAAPADTAATPPASVSAPQAATAGLAAAPSAPLVRPAITARTPPGTQFRDCAGCPPMVVVPAGSFLMGTPEGETGRVAGEGPRQRVTIAAFALAVTPITFDEWDACVAAGACTHRPGDQGWGRGSRPVVNVSWDDARAYIAWLSGPATGNYRLPTEAEWEYAARAGTATPYWWGDQVGTDNTNCRGCTGDVDLEQTAPVASFRPNAFGLHDMLGNVWQWVEDCGNAPLVGRPADGRPVLNGQLAGNCRDRALRGGSWDNLPQAVRAGSRNADGSQARQSIFGFRVAKTLPQ